MTFQSRQNSANKDLHLLCALLLSVPLVFASACGGGSIGGGTPPSNPTITSVTVSCTPTNVQTGQTSQCSATVLGTGNYSSAVTWTATGGTVTSAGVFTPSSTGTATITATSTEDSTKSGSGSVTVTAAPITVTSVSVIASPNSITTAQTSTCTATVSGTGAYSSTVTWTSTDGTITSSGIFTPSGVGTGSCIANSTQAGYTNVSGSANIIVNPAPLPNVASASPGTIYLDNLGLVGGVVLTGSNFASTDYINPAPFNNVNSAQLVSPSQMDLVLNFSGNGYSPGWFTYAICQNSDDTNCGTQQSIAFLGARNYLAASSNGELFFLDQVDGSGADPSLFGIVRIYNAAGVAVNSCSIGFGYSIAIDDKTGYLLSDGGIYDPSGPKFGAGLCDFSDVPHPQGTLPSGKILAVAAENGYAGIVQPANNSASFYDLTGGNDSQPTWHTASNLGSYPEAIAMGTFGTETDAIVLSENGIPSIYRVRASDASVQGSALPLPGITPLSTVQATNPVAGGWQVIAFGTPSIMITATSLANPGASSNEFVPIGSPSSSIAVNVSPSNITNQEGLVGWTQQYTATVSGTTNEQVIWSVDGVVGGNAETGTISTTGFYQNISGGENAGIPVADVVTATSVADPTKFGTAYIFICENSSTDTACPIFVGLSPAAVTLGPNQMAQFAAIVNDPSNPEVTWAVNGMPGGNAAVGTISASGLYTAPAVLASPAAGTIAVLSTYDQLLLLINESTWTVTKSVKLSGTPFRIAADTIHGAVIVAYADPESMTTKYVSVDALSGTVTPLTSTSSLLSVGLVISSDGTKLYSSQRNQMDVKQNQ